MFSPSCVYFTGIIPISSNAGLVTLIDHSPPLMSLFEASFDDRDDHESEYLAQQKFMSRNVRNIDLKNGLQLPFLRWGLASLGYCGVCLPQSACHGGG